MSESNIKITEEQMLMLQLSDKDIEADRLISHKQLDKNDLHWLKMLFIKTLTKP